MLLLSLAMATSGFDPSAPSQTHTGERTFTQDGQIKLWGAIELNQDPDRTLFQQEDFNEVTAWPAESDWAPWIADCFGTGTPHSSAFLLHVGPGEMLSAGTPILFVPGAGDNGSRGFITMATRMNNSGRPVYVLTFAHPHGDVLMQAEIVADAIARIKERRGVEEVDVVAHSKGGVAAAVYASNDDGDWGNKAYKNVGTRYRGDIRRLVLIATPLGGIDTAYRWPAGNYLSMDADSAVAPSSWQAWYPYTTANQLVVDDLSAQDFHPEDGDLFPGHRQLLARQDHPLPGSLPELGVSALQQDWYTTYEGGLGFYTWSSGIDAAIDDGGKLIARLAAHGVDPGVELFLLAGENPLLHNGAEYQWIAAFGESWVDVATSGTDALAELLAYAAESGLVDTELGKDELRGLAQGKLILGEVTGPSDGLVFVDSALRGKALTGRGAVVVETHTVDLAHLDLLYASPITGQLLIDAGEADPSENGWMRDVGRRYIEADTLGWVESALADPEDPGGWDSGADSGLGDSDDERHGPGGDPGLLRNCDGCGGGGPVGWGLGLFGLLLCRRNYSK